MCMIQIYTLCSKKYNRPTWIYIIHVCKNCTVTKRLSIDLRCKWQAGLSFTQTHKNQPQFIKHKMNLNIMLLDDLPLLNKFKPVTQHTHKKIYLKVWGEKKYQTKVKIQNTQIRN